MIYNTVPQNTTTITYDDTTGTFTVTEPGLLQVSWIQTTDQTTAQPLALGLQLNGTNVGSFGATLDQGQLVGSLLVDVTAVPATLQLVNTGTNAITPGTATAIQGNLIILQG